MLNGEPCSATGKIVSKCSYSNGDIPPKVTLLLSHRLSKITLSAVDKSPKVARYQETNHQSLLCQLSRDCQRLLFWGRQLFKGYCDIHGDIKIAKDTLSLEDRPSRVSSQLKTDCQRLLFTTGGQILRLFYELRDSISCRWITKVDPSLDGIS